MRLLLLPLFITSIWLQNPSPSRRVVGQDQQGQAQRTQQQTRSDQRGTEQAPISVKVLPTPKTQEETTQEAQDRAEKATNDRKLVDFTGRLVTATWAIGAIGILQLFVFGYQAYQLRKTVKAAADQSDAMERSIAEANRLAQAMESVAGDIEESTKAAVESVAITRERTAQQMRAYICVAVGSAAYQDQAHQIKFIVQTPLVNTGNTPAYNVGFKVKAAVLPNPLPEEFAFPLPTTFVGGSVIGPGPQQGQTVTAAVDDFVPDQEVENIKIAHAQALYVWGIIRYEDIFKQTQTTRFCQLITWLPDGKVFGTYIPRHNDAT